MIMMVGSTTGTKWRVLGMVVRGLCQRVVCWTQGIGGWCSFVSAWRDVIQGCHSHPVS